MAQLGITGMKIEDIDNFQSGIYVKIYFFGEKIQEGGAQSCLNRRIIRKMTNIK